MVNFDKNNEITPRSPAKNAGPAGIGDAAASESGNDEDNGARQKKNGSAPRGGLPPGTRGAEKTDINRYRDPDGLSVQKMTVGLWYVEHRRIFVTAVVLSLLLTGAVSWGYTFFHVIAYVAVGLKQDRIMTEELVRPILIGHDYLVEIGARDLQFEHVQALKGEEEGMYDVFAQVRNPNKRHIATLDYYFSAGEETFGKASAFVLPEESKYLMALGQSVGRPFGEFRLHVQKVGWRRVNAHTIPDWPAHRDDRLDISIENIIYTPAAETTLAEKLNLNDLKFTVINNTAYNYQRADFNILLVKSGKIIGVHKYILNKFGSGETHDISMTWPGSFGRVDRVMIIPEIDIMNENNYYKFEAG